MHSFYSQASVETLCRHLKLKEEEALSLITESVNIAKRARSRHLADRKDVTPPLVAGSVGPYGACLHDRSEYTGDYVDHVSREVLKAWHRPRMEVLLSAGVDVLAIETIPAQVGEIDICNEINLFMVLRKISIFNRKSLDPPASIGLVAIKGLYRRGGRVTIFRTLSICNTGMRARANLGLCCYF